MTLTALACTKCGAPLIFTHGTAICDYCGVRFSIDTPLEPEYEPQPYFYEPPESDYFCRGSMSLRTHLPDAAWPPQFDYPDDVLKANPNGA